MTQFWLVERRTEGRRRLYLCTATTRESAKNMASSTLLGDPEEYIVTPLSNPGEIVEMRINIGLLNDS